MDTYSVTVTFVEPLLGTVSKSKSLYQDYILAKAEREGIELAEEEKAQELGTVQDLADKAWTGFHRLEDGTPVIYDYVPKGFLKSACYALRRIGDTLSNKVRAYTKVIDGLIFVAPRQIPLILPEGAEMGVLERPLRAKTAQGERVALVVSDTCPPGTTMEFEFIVLGRATEAWLRELLDYGRWSGFGAWRNASYGRFTYEMEKL